MEEIPMSDNMYGFRTAINGFHKGDVAEYIEKIASQYHSELTECEKLIASLREENRALQQQMNLMMMSMPLTQEPAQEPAPELEPVPEQEPAPEAEIAPPTVQEPEPAPAPVPVDKEELMLQELLAYRRAEAVEYNAKQRAKKLYNQLGSMCDNALDQFQTTDVAVKQAVQEIMTHISTLEQSYQKISEALIATKEQLTTISTVRSSELDD